MLLGYVSDFFGSSVFKEENVSKYVDFICEKIKSSKYKDLVSDLEIELKNENTIFVSYRLKINENTFQDVFFDIKQIP